MSENSRIERLEVQAQKTLTGLELVTQSLQQIVKEQSDSTRGNAALDTRVRAVEMKGARQAGWLAGAVFVAALLLKGLDYVLPAHQPQFPIDEIVKAIRETK